MIEEEKEIISNDDKVFNPFVIGDCNDLEKNLENISQPSSSSSSSQQSKNNLEERIQLFLMKKQKEDNDPVLEYLKLLHSLYCTN